MRFRTLLTLLMAGFPALLSATPSLPAIDRYEGIYLSVKAAEAPRSLQPLFDAALAVQEALMTLDATDYAWLERISDAEAMAVQARLPGLVLHRGYDVHVAIDAPALADFAAAHGKPEDLAFFQGYAQSYSDQALPVYLRFADRVAPCVRFGEAILADQYAGWQDFQQRYPQAYAAFVEGWLRDIEDVIRHGTCTCTTSPEPVMASLADFIERFPHTPVRADVEARLRQLREQPHAKPVWCR